MPVWFALDQSRPLAIFAGLQEGMGNSGDRALETLMTADRDYLLRVWTELDGALANVETVQSLVEFDPSTAHPGDATLFAIEGSLHVTRSQIEEAQAGLAAIPAAVSIREIVDAYNLLRLEREPAMNERNPV